MNHAGAPSRSAATHRLRPIFLAALSRSPFIRTRPPSRVGKSESMVKEGSMPGLLFALLQIALASHAAPSHTHAAPPSAAIANENRLAAGSLGKGVLTLNLEAREALWYPEEGASQP